MDYPCNRRYLQGPRTIVSVALWAILATAITTLANAQSVSSQLEIEAINTKEFGRVLLVRTTIKNETDRNIFLTNFLFSLKIERMNEQKQFENFFDTWFITLRFDSTRAAIEDITGLNAPDHNAAHDQAFLDELNLYNQYRSDSKTLAKWCDVQVARIETIRANTVFQFYTNVNSLPTGRYRFRYVYKSVNGGVPILPSETFNIFEIPNTLLDFVRWTDSIDAGYLYLTIR